MLGIETADGPNGLYNLGDDNCGDNDKCHITSDDYDDGDTAATFSDTLRLNLRDGDKDAVTRDAEFEVDFQAYVMDMAGNIGYSDSEPAAPRIINNLGEPFGEQRGDDPPERLRLLLGPHPLARREGS